MKNKKLRTETGKYICIRSSESRDAMIGWGETEYDKKSERWFEMWMQKFSSCYQKETQQRSEAAEIAAMALDHIEADLCQSICEMFYDKNRNTPHVHIKLQEIRPHEVWHFAFGMKRADRKKIDKLINIIRTWHISGKIRMRDLKRCGCYISWEQC